MNYLLGSSGCDLVLQAPIVIKRVGGVIHTHTHTQGTITDDSDVFLFGGQKVYRHFFSQDKNVESLQQQGH